MGYDKPKILLIDMPEDVRPTLEEKGYNVSAGSFGRPYSPRNEYGVQLLPLHVNGVFPRDYAEQEIIITDLTGPPDAIPLSLRPTDTGSYGVPSRGTIDPRPWFMKRCVAGFDRIFAHGGVFIIFATERTKSEYANSRREKETMSNWAFLTALYNLDITPDRGTEALLWRTTNQNWPLGTLLAKHLKECEFFCKIKPPRGGEGVWTPLVTNKYGEAIGWAFAPARGKGILLILPHFKSKADFLVTLVHEILPDHCPALFPHFIGRRWVHRPEYEFPQVLEKQDKIRVIRQQAEKEIANLAKEIEDYRGEHGYVQDLLLETGAALVETVERTFSTLGFKNVVNVDQQLQGTSSVGGRREDLQVHDYSPILIVEVKGIAGAMPTDDDALAVHKYVSVRSKEWQSHEVKGLTIINYQRHLPALERNSEPFREDVVTAARDLKIGLLTTWNLFRLIRSALRNGWTHEQIKDVLYGIGPVEPVPVHYEFLGFVEKYFEKNNVVGFQVQQGGLIVGDRVGYELPNEFVEEVVSSIGAQGNSVTEASFGMQVGLKTSLTKNDLKKGTRVFRVRHNFGS